MNYKIITVSQVNAYIKKMFDMDYIVKNIWIQGEVSNCKVHSSGHIYFTLKDENSSISCVLFKTYRKSLSKVLKDGMNIIANGSVSIYEKSGQYQLYVREYMEDGIGLLYEKFEALKEKLGGKGWFLDEYKKQIPFYPKKVGIITSETGAVIQDILNIAKRRNPYIQLVLYPSLVQGDEAKYNIVEGIKHLDSYEDIDVIILGRGGGSLEDLWPFNEEIVARAIYEAKTPIISAVGHETDYTISDFVADLRAPTPSAAAELAIPSIEDIQASLIDLYKNLNQVMDRKIEDKKNNIDLNIAKLERFNPRHNIEQMIQYMNEMQDRLENIILNNIKDKKNQILLLSERIKRISPIEKIKDGYAYLIDNNGYQIKTIDILKLDDTVTIQLFDGQIKTKVIQIEKGKINYE